jgi:hypothetical protein
LGCLRTIAIALVLTQPAVRLFGQTQPSFSSPTYIVRIQGLRVAEMSPDEQYLAALISAWTGGCPADCGTANMGFTAWHAGSEPPFACSGTASNTLCSLHKRRTTAGRLCWRQFLTCAAFAGLGGVTTNCIAGKHKRARSVPYRSSRGCLYVGRCAGLRSRLGRGDPELEDNQNAEFKMLELLRVDPRLDRSSLAWRGDGGAFAVSVPDNPPCLRGGGTIYMFDPTSIRVPTTFRVPLLPSGIAFGTGNHLYVASNSCGCLFAHWTLDLPVFDSSSGQQIGKISAGRVGFRGQIAISASKQILLAHADQERTTIGFPDPEPVLKTENEQWQVWDLSASKLLLTFPESGAGSVGSHLFLSGTGHFLCSTRAGAVEIFTLPMVKSKDR